MKAMLQKTVRRVKDVKDRILFYLDVIKQDQDSFFNSTMSIINKLSIQLTEQATDHKTQLNLLQEQNFYLNQKLDVLSKRILPVDDPFSATATKTDYRISNPEVVLLQYLRSFLSNPNVLDIGANIGEVSQQ